MAWLEKNTVLVTMILLAVASRFLPHAPNFTAVGAVALFAGSHFKSKSLAYLVPFFALIVSDLVLGFHETMWAVYFAFFLVVGIGQLFLQERTFSRTIKSSLAASIVFFLVSNFGVWFSSGMYEASLNGLMKCYFMALPFLGNQVAGDLTFVGLLFFGFSFVEKKILSPRLS